MSKKIIDIQSLSCGEFRRLRADIAKCDWFFCNDFTLFGRRLSAYILGNKVMKLSEDEIVLEFEKKLCYKSENSAKSFTAVVSWLILQIFGRRELPFVSLKELLDKVNTYVNRLKQRRQEYQRNIAQIKAKKCKTGIENCNLKMYENYIARVDKAFYGVYKYITGGIANDAKSRYLEKVRCPLLTVDKIHVLSALVEKSDVRLCDDLAFKFLEYKLSDLKQFEELYKTKPRKFISKVQRDLNGWRLKSLRRLLKSNHILSARRKVIEEGLDLYAKKKYQAAGSILALQIEGVIRDALVDAGDTKEKWYACTLSNKVDRFEQVNSDFFAADYFKFKFQALRNEIAHGDAQEVNYRNAIMIVLDLCALCEFIAKDDEMAVNKMLKLLKDCLEKNSPVESFVKYVQFCINNKNVSIPDFYKQDDAVRQVRKTMKSAYFRRRLAKHLVEIEEKDPIKVGVRILEWVHNSKLTDDMRDKFIQYVKNEESVREAARSRTAIDIEKIKLMLRG